MKALSIRQPWAWLIVRGFKPVENRDWFTSYRGQLLIHAAKTYDEDTDPQWLERMYGGPLPPREFFARLQGGIVGTADLTDCTRAHPSPWFFGKYGFVLDNARPLPFMPCRGFPGMFDVDYQMEQAA